MYLSRLKSLQEKHQQLEHMLSIEEQRPHPDEIRLRQLKKQKLQIRDEMLTYETAEAA